MDKNNNTGLNLAKSDNPVEISSEAVTTDPRRNEMLRDLGKMFQPTGGYLGSFCTHIYATTDLLGLDRSIATITQQVGAESGLGLVESASGAIIKTALVLQKDEIMRTIDPDYAPRTLNRKDRRNSK